MKFATRRLFLLGLIFFTFEFTAQAVDFRYSGSVKTYSQGTFLSEGDSSYSLLNSLRINGAADFSESLIAEAHYELMPNFSPPSSSSLALADFATSATTYRWHDLDSQLYPSADQTRTGYFSLSQNLDRLNVRWALLWGDLTVGRQAIAFGAAKVINPTDVLVPFGLQTLNQEYRVGVDAIRFQIPLGELSELDLGVVVGQEGRIQDSAAFVRGKTSFLGNELALIALFYRGAGLAGWSFQRPIWNLGFSWEGAVTFPEAEGAYLRFSAGVDYAFTSDVFAMLEYHFNGVGKTSASEYLASINQFAYAKGGIFYFGQNYLVPSVSWQLTPLLGSTGSLFVNLDDRSALLSLSFSYNVVDDAYIDLGGYLSMGKRSTLPDVQSEFGLYPSVVYGAARYYY